ncbi:MAG TPA: NIPSNAP family protein [Chitinophagaceae bacterium]|nr:NIPSNAP family protein [Chitinophagaceae bacterium]
MNLSRFLIVGVLSLFIVLLTFKTGSAGRLPRHEFYQLTIIHFQTAAQEHSIDSFLQQAYLPALHKEGVEKIGVFKGRANDTSANKIICVVIPVRAFDKLFQLSAALAKNKDYQAASTPYADAPYSSPPYTRIENILLQDFPTETPLQAPSLNGPRKDRVYELRSYESPTEKLFQNKVKMFTAGDEIGLFKRLNFNAIFYGQVIAGSKMPNLMYMTSFENMADRDAHWKSFGDDQQWKKLSALPEYQHNVSHIDITFLYPVEYSDL